MDNIIVELEERDILSRMCERAFPASFRRQAEKRCAAEAHLDELEQRVGSLGIPTLQRCLIPLREVHPRFLMGRGKVEEPGRRIIDEDIDLVVFDHDLSPAQQRNLEAEWKVTLIDRREVILDIFADRANSREAVLQAAPARMRCSLTRAWTHLSRQRGGTRGNRGKGETQLETDRRLVLDKIAGLKNELARVHRGGGVRRKRRSEHPVPSVSLAGYTNAGKSSLLNALSGAAVRVADAGSPELDEQIAVTEGVLKNLGAAAKPRILVLNKIDSPGPSEAESLLSPYPGASPVSALCLKGLENLLERLGEELDAARRTITLQIPPNRWDLHSMLHRESTVVSEDYDETGVRITVRLNQKEAGRFSEYAVQT